jgi:hypothetical protein
MWLNCKIWFKWRKNVVHSFLKTKLIGQTSWCKKSWRKTTSYSDLTVKLVRCGLLMLKSVNRLTRNMMSQLIARKRGILERNLHPLPHLIRFLIGTRPRPTTTELKPWSALVLRLQLLILIKLKRSRTAKKTRRSSLKKARYKIWTSICSRIDRRVITKCTRLKPSQKATIPSLKKTVQLL